MFVVKFDFSNAKRPKMHKVLTGVTAKRCLSMHAHACLCMYVDVSVCMCSCVCVHVHVCVVRVMHARVCVCLWVMHLQDLVIDLYIVQLMVPCLTSNSIVPLSAEDRRHHSGMPKVNSLNYNG